MDTDGRNEEYIRLEAEDSIYEIDVFDDQRRPGARMKNRSADFNRRYRAFRDELQREIFVNKNYDISIIELEKKHGIYKGRK